eukprot:scaffold2062_cov273-Chaetoceros_neogracile.AAC.26
MMWHLSTLGFAIYDLGPPENYDTMVHGARCGSRSVVDRKLAKYEVVGHNMSAGMVSIALTYEEVR